MVPSHHLCVSPLAYPHAPSSLSLHVILIFTTSITYATLTERLYLPWSSHHQISAPLQKYSKCSKIHDVHIWYFGYSLETIFPDQWVNLTDSSVVRLCKRYDAAVAHRMVGPKEKHRNQTTCNDR
ncbi:hypothetical protein OG21DRAFT_973176 [Imleria badia]|nr:hypothetical protein OG21DRAFT_973176 [Imleria badia]